MKTLATLAAAALCAVFAFASPVIVAERGGQGEYDVNASGAFKTSLAKGIKAFTLDVRFTKDRALVVMRDAEVSRTSDGKGTLEDMTLEEVRRLRLQACSEPVPTLDEALAVFAGRKDVFVEIIMQAAPGKPPYTGAALDEYCRGVAGTARRRLAEGAYVLASASEAALATMRRVAPGAPLCLNSGGALDETMLARAQALGCTAVAASGTETAKEMVARAHAAGMSVRLSPCNSKRDYDAFAAKGADRVASDYPGLLARAVEGRPKKVVAMDLDATLCQHRSPIPAHNMAALRALDKTFKCVMIGAGNAPRIYRQMGEYPIDIVGNYGMQIAKAADGNFRIVKAVTNEVDRAFFREKTDRLRAKYGYTEYEGQPLEFHASGMVTFGLLGTSPSAEHKVAFDPDRKKRRAMYKEVCEIFKDFSVYIGGSTSFDFAGLEYNKYDATLAWAKDNGYTLDDIVFIGDDFADGGGDSHVRIKGMDHIVIYDYRDFADAVRVLLDY